MILVFSYFGSELQSHKIDLLKVITLYHQVHINPDALPESVFVLLIKHKTDVNIASVVTFIEIQNIVIYSIEIKMNQKSTLINSIAE